MYCGKCGAKNEDSAKFCANCGEMIPGSGASKTPGKRNHRIIGIIAVVLVAAIVILSGFALFGGRSATDTAAAMLEALTEFDLVQAYNLYPKPVQEILIEQEGITADEYRQMLIERNDEVRQELSMLGSEIKWENGDLEDVSAETLTALKKLYKEEIGIDITAAKHLPIKMTVNVWGFSQSQTMDAILIKYKGTWYLDYDSAGDLL